MKYVPAIRFFLIAAMSAAAHGMVAVAAVMASPGPAPGTGPMAAGLPVIADAVSVFVHKAAGVFVLPAMGKGADASGCQQCQRC